MVKLALVASALAEVFLAEPLLVLNTICQTVCPVGGVLHERHAKPGCLPAIVGYETLH